MVPLPCLDLSFPAPAENLACDEALLDEAEGQGGSAVIRFWESSVPFVVLGYANKVAEEVGVSACRELGIPILRRCSGGGTVVQGPGCLNYAVVLRMDAAPGLQSITGTNQFVMERTRRALARALNCPVTVEGHTDLAVGDLKFSGNAQRRKRDWLLFHGTVLLQEFDLGLIARVLLQPPRQPDYRRRREHGEFVTRLALGRAAIKEALCAEWRATEPPSGIPMARVHELVLRRYSRDDWNLGR